MVDNRHYDALSAFESDSLFEGIHSALKQYRRKQKTKTKSSSEQLEWIIEEKRLKHAEAVALKQLSNSVSKLMDELEEEKASSAYSSVQLVKEDIVAFETSSSTFEHTSGLKDTIVSLSRIDNGEGVKQHGLRAQLILDMKRNLSVVGGKFDQHYVMLEGKVKEHRESVLQLLADKSPEKTCHKVTELLPKSLIIALADARRIENKIVHLTEGDCGEFSVILLERELRGEFAGAKEKLDMTLARLVQSNQDIDRLPNFDEQSDEIFRSIFSAYKQNTSLLSTREYAQLVKRLRLALQKSEDDVISFIKAYESQRIHKDKERSAFHEYSRRRLCNEKKGLKDVEKLIHQLECRIKSIEAKKQNQMKSNELHLKIRGQLIDGDEANKIKNFLVEDDSGTDSRIKYEIDVLEKRKRALWTQAGTKQRDTFSIRNEVITEASRLSQHSANKVRTNHREEERKNKIESKKNSDIASFKAEINRLERLHALAATVPYYRSIVNATSDIHKTTEARKHDVFTNRDGTLADFQCGLQQLKSFTTEKIFSDPKFRLANALHAAGVAQSNYARNVVRSVIPRDPERTTGIEPH